MNEQNQQPVQPEPLASQGEALQGPTLPPQQPPIPPQNLNPVPPPQHKNWIKWVLIIVFVVLLASIATYFVLNSQSQKPPPPQIVQTTPTPKPQVAKTNQATLVAPTPLPSKASATEGDQTANWKTYTNTEENFSLKYPSDWNLNEDKGEINTSYIILLKIKSPERKVAVYQPPFSLYEVLVSTKSKKGETTLGQEVDQQIQESTRSPGTVVHERKKIIVAGEDAERLTVGQDTGLEHVVVYTINKDKIYLIVFTASFIEAGLEEKFGGEFKTLTDQILSTFKFTQ